MTQDTRLAVWHLSVAETDMLFHCSKLSTHLRAKSACERESLSSLTSATQRTHTCCWCRLADCCSASCVASSRSMRRRPALRAARLSFSTWSATLCCMERRSLSNNRASVWCEAASTAMHTSMRHNTAQHTTSQHDINTVARQLRCNIYRCMQRVLRYGLTHCQALLRSP